MRSATRVLLAVAFVGIPVVFVDVVAVGWWRSGEPPDWPYRVWPHLLQLWGAGLIVESALQMVFLVASVVPTDKIDGVYVVDRASLLWTVAILALVVTPALVAWRTSVMIGARPTTVEVSRVSAGAEAINGITLDCALSRGEPLFRGSPLFPERFQRAIAIETPIRIAVFPAARTRSTTGIGRRGPRSTTIGHCPAIWALTGC